MFSVFFIFLVFSCSPAKETGDLKDVQTFEIRRVALLDGPFQHATELNVKSLLEYEPDRLLARFRSEAGLEPKAEHYGGWEAQTLAGHSLGHHLSACALIYQTTGDDRFYDRAVYIVNELDTIQKADGDGYIGAFPDGKKVFEEEVAKGDIRAQRFDLNGIWAPFYTQHKVMAGLRDAYRLLGIEKALEVERKFADWVATVVNPLSNEQVQQMLYCEYGGMTEVLVDLYIDTGDEKYLNMSRIFHDKVVLDSLARKKDILPGIHGNTQIPKLIGLARRYEVTGDESDSVAATFFWDRVVNHHSYVTGGHGNHEYFGQPDQLNYRLSSGTTETCNVYNMLKLTSDLFRWEPKAEVADFYERALFNHILSSQHPGDGRVIYNLSLEMGGNKHYQDPYGFTCCVGSGMESHSKYGKNIFYYNDDELYISQFIAAELNWEEKGIRLRQITNFPEEQGTTLELESEEPQKLTIKIRYPYWAENGMKLAVNGNPVKVRTNPSSFAEISRTWKTGDKIEVQFPFSLRLETMPDNENRIAIMYGPLVLAADLGPEDDPASEEPGYVPILLTENRNPEDWLEVMDTPNNFQVLSVGHPRNFTLRPFYKIHERNYTVYLDIYNEEQWEAHLQSEKAELERKQKLEEMTYDFFQPGDDESEKMHNFSGEDTYTRNFRDRSARSANRGGWFALDMKVMKGQPMALVVEYWGGFTGTRTFDILVDEQKIATEDISGKKDGQFIDVQYDIPEELTTDVSMVTVRFQPHEGNRAGPVFGVRTIKR